MSKPTRPRKKPLGRPPRDPSGATEPLTVRLTSAVRERCAEAAGEAPLATWAAHELEAASATTRPRFGTLEEVLAYVRGLPEVERAALLYRLAPTLGRGLWLDGAIASAWMAGRNAEIRAVCENYAKGRP